MCPNCSEDSIVKIQLTLHHGDAVDFQSCPRCEHKWWKSPNGNDSAGALLNLNQVLNLATVRKSA